MQNEQGDRLHPHLQLVRADRTPAPPAAHSADSDFESLLASSLDEFISGEFGLASAGLEALSDYLARWPGEFDGSAVPLSACKLAGRYWLSGLDADSSTNLFRATWNLVQSGCQMRILQFVLDASANDLVDKGRFSDLRDLLTWSKTQRSDPKFELLLKSLELNLALSQSGAAAAREDLLKSLEESVSQPWLLDRFSNWFPLYLSGLTLARYYRFTEQFHQARQSASFAKILSLQANAPLYRLRALETEEMIACDARQPKAMFAARTERFNLSDAFNVVLRGRPNTAASAEPSKSSSQCVSERAEGEPELVLSKKEMSILKHVQKGDCNKEIGRKLNISADTVKYHLKNVFQKLGAKKRLHAVQIARERGLLRGTR